jgi:hypothetical protein
VLSCVEALVEVLQLLDGILLSERGVEVLLEAWAERRGAIAWVKLHLEVTERAEL